MSFVLWSGVGSRTWPADPAHRGHDHLSHWQDEPPQLHARVRSPSQTYPLCSFLQRAAWTPTIVLMAVACGDGLLTCHHAMLPI